MSKKVLFIALLSIIVCLAFSSCGEKAKIIEKEPGPEKDPMSAVVEESEVADELADITPGDHYKVSSELIIGEEYNGQVLDFVGSTLTGTSAVRISGSDISVNSLVLSGMELVIESSAERISLYDCNIIGNVVDNSADGVDIKDCYITGSVSLAPGAALGYSMVNGDITASGKSVLVAKNIIDGVVKLSDAQNSVLLSNKFASKESGILLSRCDYCTVANNNMNKISAPVTAESCRSLLLTGNTAYSDSVAKLTDCEGSYGSDVAGTSENAVGADESLLPKVGSDRFEGFEASDSLFTDGKLVNAAEWVRNNMTNGTTLIIPPGVYTVDKGSLTHFLFSGLENINVYAYGVMFVFEDYRVAGFGWDSCTNINLFGLTVDNAVVPNTQGTVVSSTVDSIVWKADEGYPSNIYDAEYYTADGAAEVFRAGCDYAYSDAEVYSRELLDDGTVKLKGNLLYNIDVGDKMIFRGIFAHSSYFDNCSDMRYEDVTIFSASGFGIATHRTAGEMNFNRIAVTPGAKPEGATEERLISTCDATHFTAGRGELRVTNCLFEKMTDDGTNINGNFANFESYDSQNKTLYFDKSYSTGFKKGDSIAICTEDGLIVCKTKATADAVEGSVAIAYNGVILGNNLIVENRSANSGGFLFENNLVQKIRSRGILIKASGSVRNCTVRYCGMAGILVSPEIDGGWGESCFAEDLTLENNLLESTGTFWHKNPTNLYNAITIEGGGYSPDEPDRLPFRNITIKGNRVVSRYSAYALYAEGAFNLVVENNDFGVRVGKDPERPIEVNMLAGSNDDTAASVLLESCHTVTLTGNTYPKSAETPIKANETNTKVAGSDLE